MGCTIFIYSTFPRSPSSFGSASASNYSAHVNSDIDIVTLDESSVIQVLRIVEALLAVANGTQLLCEHRAMQVVLEY